MGLQGVPENKLPKYKDPRDETAQRKKEMNAMREKTFAIMMQQNKV